MNMKPDLSQLPKCLLNKDGTLEEVFCIICGARWWGCEKRDNFRCGICADFEYRRDTMKLLDKLK